MEQSRLPNRSSIRLTDYDYAQNGAYFVTICAAHAKLHVRDADREPILAVAGYRVIRFLE